MSKLARAFNNAAKRTFNIALGGTMVLAGLPLIVAGPAVGICLVFAGVATLNPLLLVGAYGAFMGGVGGGSVIMGNGFERLQR